MESSLPAVEVSCVELTRGLPGESASAERESEPKKVLKLVHLVDPKSGVFSQQKKQCDLWEFVWGTSLLLASLLARVDWKGCNMLELGGGSGLCSLAALSSGGQVTMTDLVQDAVDLWKRSAEENGVSNVSCKALDWNKQDQVEPDTFDVVFGSDVLFFRGAVKPVAATYARALKPGGIGILADPFRCNTDDFESSLDDHGIYVQTFVFHPQVIAHAQNLQQKAFVDVKKVKLLVFRKPTGDAQMPELDGLFQSIQELLPSFVAPFVDE